MKRPETTNPEAAASGNHVIKHVIKEAELVGVGQQLIEKAGGDDGTRTRDLMRDRQFDSVHSFHSSPYFS